MGAPPRRHGPADQRAPGLSTLYPLYRHYDLLSVLLVIERAAAGAPTCGLADALDLAGEQASTRRQAERSGPVVAALREHDLRPRSWTWGRASQPNVMVDT